MKKLKVVLLAGLLSVGAFAGLASCGPTSDPTSGSAPTTSTQDPTSNPTSDPTTSTSDPTSDPTSVGKNAQRFETVQMESSILVGESVDLAEKITVIYSDGTSDHEFVISEGDGYVVNGSVVTFEAAGNYNLQITAGTNAKTLRYKVSVETELRRDFNSWFATIDQNYTVLNVGLESDGSLSVYGFAYHNDNEYFAMYFGEQLNTIQAKLSDGNYYEGSIKNVVSEVEFEMEFNPGTFKWTDSFGSVGLGYGVDASMFESTFDEEGNEHIIGNADTAENFTNFTVALTYGGDAISTEFIGFMDEEKSAGLFATAVNNEGEVAYDLWLIEAVGTTSVEVINEYQKTGALPSAIPSSKIDDAFDAINLSKNYTMVVTAQALTKAGEELTEENWEDYKAFAGQQVTFVTEESVVVTDGASVVYGYTTVNDSLYRFGYSEDTETGTASPAIMEAEGTLFENPDATSLMAPTSGTADLVFSGHQASDTMDMFVSNAGSAQFDSATGAEVANTGSFARALFESAIALPVAFTFNGFDPTLAAFYFDVPVLGYNSDPDHAYSISELMTAQYAVMADGSAVMVQYQLPAETAFEVILGADIGDAYVFVYTFTFMSIGSTVTPDISQFTSLIA